MEMKMKKRFGIFGTGFLGGVIADAWKRGFLEDWELIGVCGRNAEKTAALAEKHGVPALSTVDELIALRPDYIAEAASGKGVRDNAEKILSSGIGMIVLSIGAFADEEFRKRVGETAREHGVHVHLASGAVGGFDVLRTISLMGAKEFSFRSQKNAKSLIGTPVENDHMMTDTETKRAFEGSATEAIALLPTKVNVAVASSLASVGPDNTKMVIDTVPGFVGDEYTLKTSAPGVWTEIEIYSATSEIAAWSVVAAMRNITEPFVF